MNSLRTSSSGFLITSSPVQSTSAPPVFTPAALSPRKETSRLHQRLLAAIPSTILEEELQGALRQLLKKNASQKSQIITMQSSLVLNGAYCDLVRGQLAAQEESKKKKAKGRLVGDGLPRLLTAAAFVDRVVAFNDAAEKNAAELATRKATRTERSTVMDEWKALEKDRKARNMEIRAQHKLDVAAWEEERDRAKLLHKRPGWKKPLLKSVLFSPVPKPTFAEPEAAGTGAPAGAGDDDETDKGSEPSDDDSGSGSDGENDDD
ncbi:hypothetical protein B0H15DRAFT_782219 [Mycena belliarum]|uniref:Uncharacterized protein n=1 Tax=Mycena belliarum TaxID=1033014 RepID=A0AAD6U597_9AGAR|nr:hypothetical protein B0H15DRAFT_782219 [Mycena belliae]